MSANLFISVLGGCTFLKIHSLQYSVFSKFLFDTKHCFLPRFHILLLHDTINVSITEIERITIKAITEAALAKELREQYIKNPPEGMTSDEVCDMDDEDLLDIDYFLHEFDDLDDDDFSEEGFYIF